MADELEDIIVRMKADISGYEDGLKKARATTDKEVAKIGDSLDGLKKSFAGLASAAKTYGAASAAIGTASFALSTKALNAAAALGDLRDQVGVTAENIQVLRYAFEQNGVEINQTDAALAAFSTRLGNASVMGGETAKVFEALGVRIKDSAGNIRPTNEVLNETIDAISRIGSQSERQAIAAQLFGKQAGPVMAKLLAEGVDGINRYGDELRGLGGLMSEEMITKAAQAKDSFASLKTVLETSFNIGVLGPFTDGFSEFSTMAKDKELAQAFRDLGTLVGTIATGLLAAVKAMSQLYQMASKSIDTSNIKDLNNQINLLNTQLYSDGTPDFMKAGIRERLQRKMAERTELMRQRAQGVGFNETRNPTVTTTTQTAPGPQINTNAPALIKNTTTEVKKLGEELTSSQEAFKSLFDNMNEGLKDGKFDFKSFASSVIDDIGRILTATDAKTGTSILGGILGDLGGSLSSIFSDIFGGFRADGGGVASGKAYVVGERGPELFMPGQSGSIVPNGAVMSGGGGTSVNVNIINQAGVDVQARPSSNGRDIEIMIRNSMRSMIAGGGVDDVMRNRFGARPVPTGR